jgi:integrase/recombinase XerD
MLNNMITTQLTPRLTAPIITRREPRIDELLERFFNEQDVKESSKKLYKRTLGRYFYWINQKGYDLKDVKRPEIIEYKKELLENHLSPLTVGSYVSAVRRFYEWAEAHKLYPNVAKGVKTPRRTQQIRKHPLQLDQAKSVLSALEQKSKRDFALINLLLRAGLRTIEASRADVEDITQMNGKRVLMVHGKGKDSKDDFIILTNKAYEPIKAYLETRPKAKAKEPLFISTSNNNKGQRLETRSVSFIAKEAFKAVGIDNRNITAHSLRHTTAILILESGGTLEQVQKTLRHTNISTTQIYTAYLDKKRRLKDSGEDLIENIL